MNEAIQKLIGTANGHETVFISEVRVLANALEVAVDALEFMANGCLVPPDGGEPRIEDYYTCASEALQKIKAIAEGKA